MGASIFEVGYKRLEYPELDFFEASDRITFFEQVIEEFEDMSGESGTYIYLPAKNEALDRFCCFGAKAVNALRVFGDKNGWEKSYKITLFIG